MSVVPVVALDNLPVPLTDEDFQQYDEAKVRLGRLLFFDSVLSGNRNIACSTCHHPRFATADGVSLSIGEGGMGLGPERVAGKKANMPEQRIGRHAPSLFNLGAREYVSLFHDGRLELDDRSPSGIRTPLGADMISGFQSLVAAQAMFPVVSPDEMTGHYSENDIAKAVRKGLLTGPEGAWEMIAERVRNIESYVRLFVASHERIQTASDIQFTDIANVIAEFVVAEWRADDSRFDRYLRGDDTALSGSQKRGMALFYGDAGCWQCHRGPLQTDHQFHAIALPQFGPGKSARFESHYRDVGRLRVTGDLDDAYKFRTPSLRNVSITAPYGHNGAFTDLEDMIRHHLDPATSLKAYGTGMAIWQRFPSHDKDRQLLSHTEHERILAASELNVIRLDDRQIDELLDFLQALTGKHKGSGRLGIPEQVPSGLPVER